MYNDLNRRYFDGELPSNVVFRWAEPHGEVEYIDTREDEAAVLKADGVWIMYLNAGLKCFPRQLYMTIAHEAIHIRYPDALHGGSVWKREVRRLQGLGLFLRCF